MKSSSGSGASQSKIPKITEASNLLNTKSASTKLRSAAQGVHKGAQRSQTLMRSAVKKPTLLTKQAGSTVARHVDIKPRSANVDQARQKRAQVINKDTKVRRFGHGVNAAKIAPQKAEVGEVVSRKPSTQHASASSAKSLIHKPLPSMVTSASHQQLERLLDEALTNADAHKKASRGRRSNQSLLQKLKHTPRWMTIGAALFIFVFVGAFIAMNKVPQVAIKVASTKANVAATIPSYVPSGFSFAGPVSYSDGRVSIKFKANDGSGREFTINQVSSKMSSKSLEDKVVPKSSQVQTSVVNGTTVYIYGQGNDAAWVNHGIQYTVEDKANLNSDQLLKIASSL